MFKILKPNTICRNENCTKGVDGKQKQFYSCAYCLKTQNRRSICCCQECQDEYEQQVVKARESEREISLLPHRTDMTEKQVIDLMKKPYKEVRKQTMEELSDYSEDISDYGLIATIDKINAEIDEANDAALSEENSECDSEVEPESPPPSRGRKKAKT